MKNKKSSADKFGWKHLDMAVKKFKLKGLGISLKNLNLKS